MTQRRGHIFSRKVLWHMVGALFSGVLTRGKGIVLILLVGGLFGPGVLGVWVQLTGTAALLACLAMWGLDRRLALVLPAEMDEKVRRARGTIVWLVGLVGAGVLAAAAPATGFLPAPYPEGMGPRSTLMLLLAALLLAETSRVFLVAYLTNVHRYALWYKMVLVYEWMEIAAVVVGAVFRWSVNTILLVVVAARAVLLAVLLSRQLSIRAVGGEALRDLTGGIREGLPLMVGGFCMIGVFMADRYAVDLTVGHKMAGLFTMGVMLSRMTAVLTAPVYRIVRPQMLRLWQTGDRERALEQLGWAFRYALVVCAGCGLTVALVGARLAGLVKPVYRDSAGFLPMLAAAYVVCPLIFFPWTYLLGRRKTGLLCGVAVVSLLLAAAGHIVFVPAGGAPAAAAVTTGAYVFWLVALSWAGWGGMRCVIQPAFLLKLLGPVAVLIGLLWVCRQVEGPRLLPALAAAGCLYALLSWRLLSLRRPPASPPPPAGV